MEDLPDDILLLVCRKIHGMAGDNINKIRRISQFGLVSRRMRQIERKFWRAQVNERRLTRPIKIPKEVKNNPKHIYIYTYLACHDCGGKSKFTCSKCSDNICETCAPNFTHKCDGRSSDLRCRSCVNRCPACQIPICRICSAQCFQCANIFCFDCTEHDVVNGHQIAAGDTWVKVPSKCKTIKERRKECHINKLPTEVLVLIFEYVHGLAKETTLSSMRDVVNLGVAAQFLRTAEVKFWAKYVRQILKLNVKSERSPKESFYLHLAHMPNKHRSDPKQIVIYSSFCCDHCAQKSLTKECRGCRSQVCYQNDHNCGSDVACGCKIKAFHCNSCKEEYFCDYCNRANICKECDYRCISCGDHFCSICFYSTKHTCWNSSSESSEEEEEVKEKIKCIQCTDEIEGDKDDEDTFGHCSKCDYYNEINNYKLCKKCVTPCRVCDEELCVNCMIIYHEPNEHWTTCQKCHEEWSLLDGPCDECETYDSCINCQIECKDCGKILCQECHEIHQQNHHVRPELPDEIWIEIFKIVSSPRRAKTVDSVKKIFCLGSVNKKLKRVEEKFWRHIVDTNPFFSSKLKRSTKYTPKALHLSNYFGCTDCGKSTKVKCHNCETHICMECFEYTKSVECECTSILGEPFIHCRSCSSSMMCGDDNYCSICGSNKCVSLLTKVRCSCAWVGRRVCGDCLPGLEYCESCSKQLCPWCTRTCNGCKTKLCPKCENEHYCAPLPIKAPTSFSLLPSEILVHICECIIRDPEQTLIARVISVLNFTMVNKLLKMTENYFWKFIVSKEIENEIKFIPLNRRNYMPTSLVKEPKQLFLWNHLSCASCGMLDTKSHPIELDGSLLECDKCHYSRGPFVSEDGVQYICQRCFDDMLTCCNEMSRLYQLSPELPDDILLLVFKATCQRSVKTFDAVKWISQLGSVNKQFKRVESYFWRHIVDSNPFFSSKLKTLPKHKPKDLHIKHYFGCNDCGKLTKYRCSGCGNTNMCLECYKYSRIKQCECMEKEGDEKAVFCRSCIQPCPICGVESCQRCTTSNVHCSICDEYQGCFHKVSKLHCACPSWEDRWECNECHSSDYACRVCAKQFCMFCAKTCRHCLSVVCNECSLLENSFCKSCIPFPGILIDAPQEIVLRILEMIIYDTRCKLTFRAISIINLGKVNKRLNMMERAFWQHIVAQEAANEFRLLPKNRNNHMHITQAKTPKQLFIWQHFSCAKCGEFDDKSEPVELKSNDYLKCYHCGLMTGPFSPENGVQCICQKCCKDNLDCCRDDKVRPAPFKYKGQGPEMSCAQCEWEIKNGSRQCRQCEYNVITAKELPGRHYCKKCTIICAFCETELCRSCFARHSVTACPGFATCQKCQKTTDSINYCEDCSSKGCDNCRLRCENCHGAVCNDCLQRNNAYGRVLCRACTDQLVVPDPMDLD